MYHFGRDTTSNVDTISLCLQRTISFTSFAPCKRDPVYLFWVRFLPPASEGWGRYFFHRCVCPPGVGSKWSLVPAPFPCLWSHVLSGGGGTPVLSLILSKVLSGGGDPLVVARGRGYPQPGWVLPLPGQGVAPFLSAQNQDGCVVQAVCLLRSRRRTFLCWLNTHLCNVFTLSGVRTETDTGTKTTIGDNPSQLLSWFRCNVKASIHFHTTHFSLVSVPVSVTVSVNTPWSF